MEMPLVTIAIPTHNRADSYLRDALRCAVEQTYARLDILVADNASTDGTAELVSRLRDPRVRYLRHDVAIRPNDNFNFCIAQARGEYLLLLLDDEQVDRDFVATCLDAVGGRSGIGLIRTGLRTIDGNGIVIGECPNEAAGLPIGDLFLAWFEGRTSLYLCNTLFSTRALRASGGLRSRHCLFQDVMAQVRVARASGRADVEAIKATTRSHPGQFTYSAKVREWAEDAIDLLRLMCDAAPERREAIRVKGGRFFATVSYSRANAIRAPLARLEAYLLVYRLFGYRHLPPLRVVLSATALYRVARDLKRRLKGQPRWAAAG
ncbi:glycosyl transferase [Sulfurifustis variabilis]|uniref:Glycosyl transferase n=1 Tax=Sulfurifustis variabilis TaxID=1675686 RepID=A0A1B4V3G1_9GAMM|nr:glycosyltransferase family 2 protein [Sulfurifustis variabilis]BAU48100.1 glycosyl transferase [Sulfurifustis variabilis]